MTAVASRDFEDLRRDYKVVLQRCFEKGEDSWNDLSLLGDHGSVSNGDSERRAAGDQALRDLLPSVLAEQDETMLERYVSLCVTCCRQGLVTPTMPVVLLGDVFEALTLDRCERMFSSVERGVAVWKEDLFFVACKNNLLRMCNDLLRRLSRSQNTVFCGRILLFLAKFFPFSERSGLNIVSEFNSDNVTEVVKEEEGGEMEADPPAGNPSVDYNLYCKFWALQDFFRSPNLCYNKIQWKTFQSHSGSVLSAFSSYKLEAGVGGGAATPASNRETHYFAKFLTNQKLLELQLSDSNFRRCVLLQFLILFQYLNSTVKFKMEAFELKADQMEWVNETRDLILRLLGETPPDGKAFASSVLHILQREQHWNNWKNEGCPEFQKLKSAGAEAASAASAEGGGEAGDGGDKRPHKPRRKRLLGDIIKDYESQGKYYLGNNELTKLWNLCPDNLEACRAKERDFLPSLESYLSTALAQATGTDTDPSQPRAVADGSFGWRALRLLARRSPHFFTHSNNPINRLPDYLDIMIRKVAKDLPFAQGEAKRSKQDSPEEEVSEEQMMEADLMKGGDPNDVEQSVAEADSEQGESGAGDRSSNPSPPSDACLKAVSEALAADWKQLGTKLGYKSDEMLYLETTHPTPQLCAKNLLEIWFSQDEDACVDGLAYELEGLGLHQARQVLLNFKV